MQFLRGMVILCLTAACAQAAPNVVLIIADDQGYGDLGHHGNPVLRTPRIDAFARESVEIDPFYVCPVCSPTRAALLTGRYNYRTGVVDTYIGRSMMDTTETTLAEVLQAAGYRTGIFGKWHLGDNYPLRPMDQGFDESLVHRGGGITQSSDPPYGSGYFDPVVYRSGIEERAFGYCTDVFTDEATNFIRANAERPFFAYVAYNAPHNPLHISPGYADPYRALEMSADDFDPDSGRPVDKRFDPEKTARAYGMVTNIDDNVGRILDAIDGAGIRNDTIVIFMTDNGPQHPRFNGGLRGLKGTVFEGGIRAPFFLRWPGKLDPGLRDTTPCAHIDVMPTLLDLCGVPRPEGLRLDGHSIVPVLRGSAVSWANRPLVFQWHRGDAPVPYRAFSLRQGRYKLLQANGVSPNGNYDPEALMLFDLVKDPFEKRDLASERPGVVRALRASYDAWFDDVTTTRGFAPVRIVIGAPQETRTQLTRQDWRSAPSDWESSGRSGAWEVTFHEAAAYDFLLEFPKVKKPSRVTMRVAGKKYVRDVLPGRSQVSFESLAMPKGDASIQGEFGRGGNELGVHYVTVSRAR